jgi:hypothetical protein
MGTMTIVAYRPKAGREAELESLVREHAPYLRNLGLVTNRPATAMRGRDGTVVEVFEWVEGGTTAAHANPKVRALWERFGRACDYVPLRELPEAAEMFAGFSPIDLETSD